MAVPSGDDALIDAFAFQVAWCAKPSPFTSRLLARTLVWLREDAAAHAALAAVASDPLAGAMALRWAGALHHLALQGLEPWAGLWPPNVPAAAGLDAALDAAIRRAWRDHRAALDAALAHPPQTNEVQRSAILLPGLLHVAAATGLPLALREIGSSAGLNLWPDRWRHENDTWAWGDATAPLVLTSEWSGPAPPPARDRTRGDGPAPLRVTSRRGCDPMPVDLNAPGEALRLTSFVWPDQTERLARLAAAWPAAARWMREEGVAVEAIGAADFVARELAAPRAGETTVVMHSIVWQYIDPAEQAAAHAAIEAAGARATAESPIAWLRFEPPRPDARPELRCRIWSGEPGGSDRLLATAHPYVATIDWRA